MDSAASSVSGTIIRTMPVGYSPLREWNNLYSCCRLTTLRGAAGRRVGSRQARHRARKGPVIQRAFHLTAGTGDSQGTFSAVKGSGRWVISICTPSVLTLCAPDPAHQNCLRHHATSEGASTIPQVP